ncbi:BTAD domain-containing putative transcriptional regulator [Streptomyces sp. NPDC059917]|uniref:AfsR/SARP family transcriptional regulator n=1 Tax=Streptomyces sp. NPDC059917 TaxID=3347002 RepID=UPI00365AFA9C
MLTPRAAKIRVVLATLLVRANEIVSVDSLIDELWGENPPRTATTTLQVYVSQLRKLLHGADPEYGRDSLVTRPPGYLLRLDPAQLDLTVFEELHQRGREAMQRGDRAAAADLQRQALALWRAPLVSDTPHGPLLDSIAVRLAEVRTAALEQRVRAELHLGRHQDLVGELQAIVSELPMREEFHAHLMVALYRTGRQADALRVFARLRRALVDELAVEPGRPLQVLHQRILTGDPTLLQAAAQAGAGPSARTAARGAGAGSRAGAVSAAGGSAAVPAPPPGPSARETVEELPARDPVFVGRAEALDDLSTLLRDVPVGGCVAITGAAGTGKTALAVTAAHQLGELFPGGRVFLELGGAAPRDPTAPEDPAAAAEPVASLVRLLRRFGLRGELPADEAGLRRVLRGLTEGRRVLLVLDGVESAEQVRALLPDTPGSTALLTGRRVPDGLTSRVLTLDVLPQDEARALFTAAAGRPVSPRGGQDAVREIAALCGGLPLALRAAAARLASRPHWGPEMLASRLRDEDRRLGELRAAAPGFYSRLRSSYDAVDASAKRAFRFLGLLPAGPFAAAEAAAVLGVASTAAAEGLLEVLARERLLAVSPPATERGTRYRLHDMWRLLAVERLAAEGRAQEVRPAVARLADVFCAQAREAARAVRVDGMHPLEWFAQRQDALLTVVRRCHADGLWSDTVALADAMAGFLEAQAAWESWETSHQLALDAARQLEDLAVEARLLRSLGDLAWQRRSLAAAGDYYERALLTADAAPAAAERGRALVGLADLQLDAGAAAGAAALVSPALDAVAGDPRGRYEAQRVLGLLALETDGPVAALAHFTECLGLAVALADHRLEAYARRWLQRLRRPQEGAGGAPAGWSEVRPGVWRLPPSTI